jgi:hypothetical protein
MSNHAIPGNRRRFIKLSAAAIATAPLTAALMSRSAVAAPVTVNESDPTAAALAYKADATKATARKDAAAVCRTCNFYTGKAGDPEGPCTVLQGNLVNAKGWCTAWVKKP